MQIRLAKPLDATALETLFAAAEAAHDREAVSEHKRIRVLGERVIDIVAAGDGRLLGYAQAAWHGGGREPHWAAEIVTHPDAEDGLWSELCGRVIGAVPSTRMRFVWVTRETDLPKALSAGWSADRTLHEMHVELPHGEVPPAPDGVAIRPFRRGIDERAWLDTHNASFAGHPEVGGMTEAEFEMRLEQSWFDPEGLLLAWDGDTVIGSCWTKLHGAGVGEIYLIGLRPSAQGRGLGRLLVAAGLADLSGRQAATDGMLWVDGANASAVALYEGLGFAARATIYRMAEATEPSSIA